MDKEKWKKFEQLKAKIANIREENVRAPIWVIGIGLS